MDIAIVGAGLTGLTAAYDLTKTGHAVTVFEQDAQPGGLAAGFRLSGWSWPLEKTYHHYFTNDAAIISLAHELGLTGHLMTLAPVTATWWDGTVQQLDSAMSLLRFHGLSVPAKIRTATLLALAKILPYLPIMGSLTAESLATTIGGHEGWRVLWEPLMAAKFGPYAHDVAASWFWARIHKRTPKLGYFEGGFAAFTDALAVAVTRAGGTIRTSTTVTKVRSVADGRVSLAFKGGKPQVFDRVLLTVPSGIAAALAPFPHDYAERLLSIPHLWAQTLIVETDRPILPSAYWLNVNDTASPFLAVVAHTNMISPKHYGGRHVTYIGNYLTKGHRFLSMDAKRLYGVFLPYLARICPSIRDIGVHRMTSFVAPDAQPVHTVGYETRRPGIATPIPGISIANLDSVFPWDRGTNYAVELGHRAATAVSGA